MRIRGWHFGPYELPTSLFYSYSSHGNQNETPKTPSDSDVRNNKVHDENVPGKSDSKER